MRAVKPRCISVYVETFLGRLAALQGNPVSQVKIVGTTITWQSGGGGGHLTGADKRHGFYSERRIKEEANSCENSGRR